MLEGISGKAVWCVYSTINGAFLSRFGPNHLEKHEMRGKAIKMFKSAKEM